MNFQTQFPEWSVLCFTAYTVLAEEKAEQGPSRSQLATTCPGREEVEHHTVMKKGSSLIHTQPMKSHMHVTLSKSNKTLNVTCLCNPTAAKTLHEDESPNLGPVHRSETKAKKGMEAGQGDSPVS